MYVFINFLKLPIKIPYFLAEKINKKEFFNLIGQNKNNVMFITEDMNYQKINFQENDIVLYQNKNNEYWKFIIK